MERHAPSFSILKLVFVRDFNVEVGLRQGCILSPLLFLLFINDLCDAVNNLNKGVRVGNRKISILFFADDIGVLAENKEDLEYMLQFIYTYSIFWRFKFNMDKCSHHFSR